MASSVMALTKHTGTVSGQMYMSGAFYDSVQASVNIDGINHKIKWQGTATSGQRYCDPSEDACIDFQNGGNPVISYCQGSITLPTKCKITKRKACDDGRCPVQVYWNIEKQPFSINCSN
ncbi:hypothetical protein K7432_015157 [Basidiobolus ranarum]|uniref:Uncharacterized protein n=1 Tax=Basidiobolus ranarum TaxID=34480 RepID=A0ABR2WGK6_9FUNG